MGTENSFQGHHARMRNVCTEKDPYTPLREGNCHLLEYERTRAIRLFYAILCNLNDDVRSPSSPSVTTLPE